MFEGGETVQQNCVYMVCTLLKILTIMDVLGCAYLIWNSSCYFIIGHR